MKIYILQGIWDLKLLCAHLHEFAHSHILCGKYEIFFTLTECCTLHTHITTKNPLIWT